MRIGILALQGAFAEHRMILEKLGAERETAVMYGARIKTMGTSPTPFISAVTAKLPSCLP